MILVIAVLLILLFLACVALNALHESNKKERKHSESVEHELGKTREALESKKQHVLKTDLQVKQAEKQIQTLSDQLEELQQENAAQQMQINKLNADDQAQKESGVVFKMRTYKRATPDTYQALFELNPTGQRVLQDLVNRFGVASFASDAHGGERETCRRLGQSEVINHINLQIFKANNPDQFEQVEDHV